MNCGGGAQSNGNRYGGQDHSMVKKNVCSRVE